MAGAVEGGIEHVGADLFRQRSGIDNHGVLPAGFGNQHGAVVAFGQRLVNQARNFGRTGENHAADTRVLRQRRAYIACAEDELQRGSRNTGFVHQGYGITGYQAGLFGGLGDDGIARGQRGDHFAGENRQREVPRADGNNGAYALRTLRQGVFGFVGIVAAEIDGFAHFRDGVVQRFTGFAHGQHHECRSVPLEQVGETAQAGGAFGGGRTVPCGLGSHGGGYGFLRQRGIGEADRTDDVAVIGGIAHLLSGSDRTALTVDDGGRLKLPHGGSVQFLLKLLQHVFVAQIKALGIQTAFAV